MKISNFIIVILSVSIFLYLLGSFIAVSFNIEQWDNGLRTDIAVVNGITLALLGMVQIMVSCPAPEIK
jgi:ribonuclease PH